MKGRDPISVGDILKKLQATGPLGKQLELAQVWERWPELAGENLAAHGRPYTVKDGTLHIVVDSAVWMHRYAFHKWRIISKVNRLAGHEIISDLFMRLAADDEPLPPAAMGAPEAPTR